MKTKMIEFVFNSVLQIDTEQIEEQLGIDWNDVEDYWMKWMMLSIHMKDGRVLRVNYDRALELDDLKHPDECREFVEVDGVLTDRENVQEKSEGAENNI